MLRYGLIPLLLTACVAGPTRAENLVQAIARAVDHFPDIRAASSRQAIAQAQLGQARAEYFPSVNLALGEGRESSRNISTRTNDVTLTRQEADVSLSQLVFDGGAAGGQVRRFRARTESAGALISDTAENAGSRAGQIYVDVRRLRDQLDVARENVAIHEKTLSDVNALADAGRGRRADVTQADARRALAISSVEQLAGQLSQTESAYKFFTGRLPPELEPPPELGTTLPATMEQALRQADETHPAVRSAQKEFEAAQFDRDSTRARYALPRVTIEAGGSRNRDIDGIAGPNRDAYAMLRLRYNLFRGFGDVERVRESEARINESLAGLARARNDVERDVRQAWETLMSDRARLPQLATYARASADVAEAYRLQFQLAQRSLLDVLNAENERFNAVAGLIAGRAAVASGEIRLLASLGRLLETLGIAVPGAPPVVSQTDGSAAPTPVAAPAAVLASDRSYANGVSRGPERLQLRLDLEFRSEGAATSDTEPVR